MQRPPPSPRSRTGGAEAPASGHLGRRALVLVTVGLLSWFATRVDWASTLTALRGASLGLIALAVVAELISVSAKGLRWWLFLRPLGSESPALAIRATFAGAGLNNLLVGNGGELGRVVLVTRALNTSSARVLATIALDRAWEAVGYGTLLVVTAAITPLPATLARFRPVAFAGVAVLVVALGALARVRVTAVESSVQISGVAGGIGTRPSPLGARLANWARRFVASLAELSTWRRSLAAFALSLVVWTFQVATYALGAAAAHAALGRAGNLVTVLTVNLGFAIRTTPGGVGVFQALYALAARPFGVPGATAVAAAIIIQSVQILPVTALGLVAAPELLRRRRPTAVS